MQLLITFGFVTIQLLFTALWFTVKPVLSREIYDSDREELELECTVDEIGFAVNLSYVMVLMILCTVYAFKTRNFPKNFNESKYIGVTMYITCAVWTVFFPFYLNTTHSDDHVYLISGAYLIIGLVTLIGLFGQKVFIVYRVTELHNEDLAMTSRSGQRHSIQQPENKQISSG
jgi:metabotropic glutamate receptor 2/3